MRVSALRVLAFAVAIVAVIDPALTASRSSRPFVSLLTADTVKDGALADRVERALTKQFTVVRGAISSPSAIVVVGDEVPGTDAVAPLVAVVPQHEAPFLRILSLDAPATPALNTQIPIVVTVQARGASGRFMDVDVRIGDVRVDHEIMPADGDSVLVRATFHDVPTTVGPALLHARARIRGTNVVDEASTAIDVTDGRLAVLFFDPRASWLSTFVRRAVERDSRFAVSHRIVTSRGMSNTGGPVPQSLQNEQSLSSYGTVVVGSPEQLTDADVSGLERFMRDRGGCVLLLMDRRAAGPIDRLTEARDWRAVRLPAVTDLVDHLTWGPQIGGPGIRAQEIAWPAILPAGASVHNVSKARDSTNRPVVWSVPVGAGRLVVSGALDAWHYRDDDSRFDPFWTNVVAELAASSPPALDVSLTNRSIAPGKSTGVKVWIREAALSRRGDRSATVSALLIGPNDTTTLRLWPDNSPGTFTGTIIAPREPGVYRIVVSSGVGRDEASLIVDPAARAPARDEHHLMSAFAESRKGRVIPESELRDLPRTLSSALESVSRVETWHPMRSAWWIVPFAILLGAEWWWRRRRGLA